MTWFTETERNNIYAETVRQGILRPGLEKQIDRVFKNSDSAKTQDEANRIVESGIQGLRAGRRAA
jgi:hypothetical protein